MFTAILIAGGALGALALFGSLWAEISKSNRAITADATRLENSNLRQIAERQSASSYQYPPHETEAYEDLAQRGIVAYGYVPAALPQADGDSTDTPLMSA